MIFLTKFPEDATFQLQTFRLFLLSPSNRGSLRGSVLSSLLPTLLQPPMFLPSCPQLGPFSETEWK